MDIYICIELFIYYYIFIINISCYYIPIKSKDNNTRIFIKYTYITIFN